MRAAPMRVAHQAIVALLNGEANALKNAVSAHLIAHRGWSRTFPENSLAALAAGVTAGADEIEFDLRLSADLVPTLCHDETVDRVSNLSGPVRGFSSAELAEADIRLPGGAWAQGLGFTFLTSVIDSFHGAVRMNVHVKEADDPKLVLEALAGVAERMPAPNLYLAASPAVLQLAIEICPALPRCCLDTFNDPEGMMRSATELACERVQFRRTTVTEAHIRTALGLGLVPNLYYADEPADAERALGWGILGLLTNDIGPVRRYVRERGLI